MDESHKRINRRNLLTTIGMVGAAAVSGGVVHALGKENTELQGGNPHDKIGDLAELKTTEKANLVGAINENVDKLAEVAINVKNFGAQGDGVTDDTQAIQAAIDYVDSHEGGTVLVPKGIYVYSQNIFVREGTFLQGNGGSFLKCNAIGDAKIIVYNDVKIQNLKFHIPKQYDDTVFYFDNKYLTNRNKRDTSRENSKVLVEGVQLYTEFDPTRTKNVAFQLYASRQTEFTGTAGFGGVIVKDCFVDGFNLIAGLKTDITGWINGNTFDNVGGDHFETCVKIEKSSESLGVDYNLFKFKLQTRSFTKDIFIDPTRTNRYEGNKIWDMKTNLDSRLGIAPVQSTNNGGVSFPKERYAWILGANKYHLLGRFEGFTSLVQHVMISLNGYGNYRTDYFIRGRDEQIERRNYGTNRLHSQIQFYKRELGNGQVEIYLYTPVEVETIVYIESFRSFYPSPVVRYEHMEGLIEMTNIQDYYPIGAEQAKGVHLASDNNYTPLTPFADFSFGITYSTIRADLAPTVGSPEGKNGTLITHKAVQSPYAFNFQEYHVFNSPTGETYKRFVAGTDTFGNWIKVSG